MKIKLEPTCQHVTWIVNDFLELPQTDDSYLESPEFLFSGDIYCFRVYPEVNNRRYGRGTEIQVRRLSVTSPKREVSCKVGIRTRDSNGDDSYYYLSNALENLWYRRSSIEEKRDEYVPDGSLTVVCCMRLSKDSGEGSSAQEEEEQGGFPGHNASFSSRWSPQKTELSVESPCTYVQLILPKFSDLQWDCCDSLTSPEFRFAGDTYCFRFRANADTGDTDLQLVRLTFSIPERTVSYRVGYLWGVWHKYPKNSRSLVGNVGMCITRSKLEAERPKYEWNNILRVLLFLRLEECPGLSGIRKLQSDYRQLLQKGADNDACVVVRGTEFNVHKNVLRARSTVFEAMFGHNMAEKESGRVVIDDLDPDSFGDFLEYLYTGDVQKRLSDDNAFGLYAAADKYDVSTLKSECVQHMRRTLSVDSFCDFVNLALRHNEKDLLQQAIRFFKDNLLHIIVTSKWQQFMSDNSTSANELFIKALVPGKQ